MFIVFTFLDHAPEPKVYPKRVVAAENVPAPATAEKEVPDRVYLHAVMERIVQFPEAFEAAVETMRTIRERFLADGFLPAVT